MKFEEIENLSVLPIKGQKLVTNEIAEEFVTAAIERTCSSSYSSASAQSVSCKLEILGLTEWRIL